MRRIRINNAKLFIAKPNGTEEEIKGWMIGPYAYQMEPADADPMGLPKLRYFEAAFATFVKYHSLECPPFGSDPSKN
jgi:hypothetical protein